MESRIILILLALFLVLNASNITSLLTTCIEYGGIAMSLFATMFRALPDFETSCLIIISVCLFGCMICLSVLIRRSLHDADGHTTQQFDEPIQSSDLPIDIAPATETVDVPQPQSDLTPPQHDPATRERPTRPTIRSIYPLRHVQGQIGSGLPPNPTFVFRKYPEVTFHDLVMAKGHITDALPFDPKTDLIPIRQEVTLVYLPKAKRDVLKVGDKWYGDLSDEATYWYTYYTKKAESLKQDFNEKLKNLDSESLEAEVHRRVMHLIHTTRDTVINDLKDEKNDLSIELQRQKERTAAQATKAALESKNAKTERCRAEVETKRADASAKAVRKLEEELEKAKRTIVDMIKKRDLDVSREAADRKNAQKNAQDGKDEVIANLKTRLEMSERERLAAIDSASVVHSEPESPTLTQSTSSEALEVQLVEHKAALQARYDAAVKEKDADVQNTLQRLREEAVAHVVTHTAQLQAHLETTVGEKDKIIADLAAQLEAERTRDASLASPSCQREDHAGQITKLQQLARNLNDQATCIPELQLQLKQLHEALEEAQRRGVAVEKVNDQQRVQLQLLESTVQDQKQQMEKMQSSAGNHSKVSEQAHYIQRLEGEFYGLRQTAEGQAKKIADLEAAAKTPEIIKQYQIALSKNAKEMTEARNKLKDLEDRLKEAGIVLPPRAQQAAPVHPTTAVAPSPIHNAQVPTLATTPPSASGMEVEAAKPPPRPLPKRFADRMRPGSTSYTPSPLGMSVTNVDSMGSASGPSFQRERAPSPEFP